MTAGQTFELVTCDVFTDTPFQGNPLAILPDAAGLTTAQMQTIAQELNLSETIFVFPPSDPANTAAVRIFFPTAEIPFAGHPTIGCAIHLSGLLGGTGDATRDMVLEEVAGPVPVTVTRKGSRVTARFTAPVLPTRLRSLPGSAQSAAALGLSPDAIGNPICPSAELWHAGPQYILIPLASPDTLAQARPSGAAWDALTADAACISAWCFAPDGTGRIRARMFSPAGGTPEDPATGSAVVTFAGLYAAQGHCTSSRMVLDILQGVEMGRPSQIRAILTTSEAALSQVEIEGAAVPISSGRVRHP